MDRPSIALPKADSLKIQQMANEDPNYLSAYNICLQCEEQFAGKENKLRYIRILGYLLLNAPNRAVRSEVTRCIHSRQDDSDVVDLGSFFERYFILPCEFPGTILAVCMPIYPPSFPVLKFKGRTPSPSYHPSRPSFQAVKGQIKDDIREAPKNHSDAKIRVSGLPPLFSSSFSLLEQALMRDNWRCVVTGMLEFNTPSDIKAKLDLKKETIAFTECAHIIPESTFFRVDPKLGDDVKVCG